MLETICIMKGRKEQQHIQSLNKPGLKIYVTVNVFVTFQKLDLKTFSDAQKHLKDTNLKERLFSERITS